MGLMAAPTAARALSPAAGIPAGDMYVILIEDSFIYINAGQDKGVQVGDLFTVTRPGRAIVDPETGDTLGSDPVAIAKLRAQYAAPHYSRAYALEVVSGIPIQIRDRVARWKEERIGVVPAPAVVDLEQEAPRAPVSGEGDKIFVDKKRKAGDVVGDFEFSAEVLDYDFGDVTGDGLADLVVMEEHKVTLYDISSGPPAEVWSESIKGFLFVSVELFDADGDGREEIFVGEKLGNVAHTRVYRHKDGRVVKTGDIKGVFVRQNADGLYAQRYGFGKPFVGPVMEIRYDPASNTVTKVKDISDGPYNVLGMGIGKTRMAYLDFNDRLTITDRTGLAIWRGTNALGGSTQELVSGNGREKEKIQKKIMFDDFDGDNAEDLLVIKNELNPLWGLGSLIGAGKYKNGKFMIYTWRPGGYDVLKETREFEGYVSDYEYTVVGGHHKQLSLCLVTAAGREKFKSRILVLREL